MKDRIQLSDHFTYGRLIRFTLPSIGMMIFTSIYGVVDGFCVSNFAGKTPSAAVNLAWPFLCSYTWRRRWAWCWRCWVLYLPGL